MGYDVGNAIKGLSNSFTKAVESNINSKIKGKGAGPGDTLTAIVRERENIYPTYRIKENWYKALPYGFQFNPKDNTPPVIMYLPIAPSNLNITTHFATNVITTLYGTVEEHSPVRYFDIRIEGTTGMAPKYAAPVGEGEVGGKTSEEINSFAGRSSVKPAFSISAGGFFQQSIGIFNQVVGQINDLVKENSPNTSGIRYAATGYVAFHNLYKVLLQYKKDAAEGSGTKRNRHPLQFLNYKDGNQYDCAIQRFDLKRDASNPMLYNYSIMIRAYNLQPLAGAAGDNTLEQRRKDLGINGVDGSSYYNKARGFANKTKSILGAAIGGVKVLGR